MSNQIVGLPLLAFTNFNWGHLLLLPHNFDFGFVESLLFTAVVLVILLHLSYIVLYIILQLFFTTCFCERFVIRWVVIDMRRNFGRFILLSMKYCF